ncbi:MAG: histidine kinase [Bacteroidales bacterium]|nr:histidine kinase [Bacteroidales bacterium]
MKRIAVIIAGFLVSVSLFAQEKTNVKLNLTGSRGSEVFLDINTFSSKTMDDQVERISIPLMDSGYYAAVTEKIVRSNTLCKLFIGAESIPVILSPGDSIQIATNRWSVLNSAEFTGTAAGKNQYYKEHYLTFSTTDRYERIQNYSEHFVEDLKQYRSDEDSLLLSFYHTGQIDSSYYAFESERVNYKYFNNLLYSRNVHWKNDRENTQEVENAISRINLRDTAALYNYPEYRSIIGRFIEYQLASDGTAAAKTVRGLSERLKLAEKYLYPGPNYLYYCFNQCKDAFNKANTETRSAIYNYISKSITDPEFQRLLSTLGISDHMERTSYINQEIEKFIAITVLVILIISLLIFGLAKINQQLKRKGRRLNTMAILTASLIFIMFSSFLAAVVGDDMPVVFPLAMLAYFAAHVFWLIPNVVNKKRYGLYVIILLPVLAACCSVFLHLFAKEYGSNQLPGTDEYARWIGVTLIIISVLTLFSYFFYYVLRQARKNRPFGELFTKNIINLELLVNILLVAFVFQAFTVNAIGLSGLRLILIFILFLSVLYAHTFCLIPRYLFQKKYLKFAIYSVALLVLIGIILSINDAIFNYLRLSEILGSTDVKFIDLLSFPQNLELYLAVIPAFIYAYTRKLLAEKANQGFALFRNKEAELQQLRSQVNPHFLFNSLNTVYAFALKENNPKTAEFIAKLANLMRYLIDDMDKETIAVEKEIDYISDYINLQRIRSSVEQNVVLTTDVETPGFQIAPMLMIPFVENAFKHGINPNKSSDLRISIQVKENQLVFVAENSIDKHFEAYYKEKGFGIGILNVRQRLGFIYPNRHTLSIANTGDRFIVILTITDMTKELASE